MKELGATKIENKFVHGDHIINLLENDDPATIRIILVLHCHKCRSYIRTTIQLHYITRELRIRTIDKLYESFKKDIVESCEEAKLLGIISAIHNS